MACYHNTNYNIIGITIFFIIKYNIFTDHDSDAYINANKTQSYYKKIKSASGIEIILIVLRNFFVDYPISKKINSYKSF